MDEMANTRKVLIFGEHFWKFYHQQTPKVKKKINWTIQIVKTVEKLPKKYFKSIVGTKLFEMRIASGSNIYRIFCFFDKGKLVVVLNGFQKKSQKTPRNEIELALKLQKQYYYEKED